MSDAPTNPVTPESTPVQAQPTEAETPTSEGLSALEEQLLAEFTERGAAPDSPTPTEPPAQPAADSPHPDPGGEGGAVTPPVERPAASALPPEADPDLDPALDPEQIEVSGAPSVWDDYPDPSGSQAQAKQLLDWHQSLSPQDISTVDQALSGEFVMVPVAQIEQLQNAWSDMERWKAGQPPAGQTQQSPPQHSGEYNPYDDPEFQQASNPQVEQLQTTVAATQQQVAAMQQQQMQQNIATETERISSEIQAAEAQWRSNHPYLDDADMEVLQNHITSSNTFGPLQAQYGTAEATRISFEQAAAVIPRVQSKVTDAIVNQRVAQGQATVEAQQLNGTRASAIAGGATTPPDLSGMDPEDAMVEEIRKSMFG